MIVFHDVHKFQRFLAISKNKHRLIANESLKLPDSQSIWLSTAYPCYQKYEKASHPQNLGLIYCLYDMLCCLFLDYPESLKVLHYQQVSSPQFFSEWAWPHWEHRASSFVSPRCSNCLSLGNDLWVPSVRQSVSRSSAHLADLSELGNIACTWSIWQAHRVLWHSRVSLWLPRCSYSFRELAIANECVADHFRPIGSGSFLERQTLWSGLLMTIKFPNLRPLMTKIDRCLLHPE